MSRDRNDPDDERGLEFGAGASPLGAEDDLADLSRLRESCQSTWPPEPDEAAWAVVRTRIQDAVGAGRRRSPRPVWGALGATAAAAILAFVLTRTWWGGGVPPQPTPTEEPFPVVEAADVTILSMDAADVAALVVGEPPIGDDMEFVRPEDVRVLKCARCPHSGNIARLEPGEVPMMVTSVARADGDNE